MTLHDAFSTLKPGECINDNYVVEQLIGKGGFAEVYRVTDIDGRAWALKILRAAHANDQKLILRHTQEMLILRKINHPNVVHFEETGVHGHHVFVVMELLEGRSLRDLLTGNTSLSIERSIRITLQICAGVAAAHQLGFVHRDIKPENIYVLPGDVVKVLDFGIAKHADAPMGTTRTLGTPAYMSPDYVENVDATFVDVRWDVFSIAITLWEMIAGFHPRFGPDPSTRIPQGMLFTMILEEPMPTLEESCGCPEAISQVVATGLARDPDERWHTVLAFSRALSTSLATYIEQIKPLDPKLPSSLRQLATGAWQSPLEASMARAEADRQALMAIGHADTVQTASRPPTSALPSSTTPSPLAAELAQLSANPVQISIGPDAISTRPDGRPRNGQLLPSDPNAISTRPDARPDARREAQANADAGPKSGPKSGPAGTVRMAAADAIDPNDLAAARARHLARVAEAEARAPNSSPRPSQSTEPIDPAVRAALGPRSSPAPMGGATPKTQPSAAVPEPPKPLPKTQPSAAVPEPPRPLVGPAPRSVPRPDDEGDAINRWIAFGPLDVVLGIGTCVLVLIIALVLKGRL